MILGKLPNGYADLPYGGRDLNGRCCSAMPVELLPEQTSEIVPAIDPDVQLYADGGVAIKSAPMLRQMSRDLRAVSEALRAKNLDVMSRASEVAGRYYDLTFGLPPYSDLD